MKYLVVIAFTAGILLFSSCGKNKNQFDASGSFEAEETIISSEASGAIKEFNLEEGQVLQAGQIIGYVDTTQLYLRKKQLNAQVKALLGKKPNLSVQIASLQEQLKTAEHERDRIGRMQKADAATQKQLDDMNAQVEILKKQIDAQKSTLDISTEGINNDALPLTIQIEQIDDQLHKSILVNPVPGTVLTKFVEQNEIVSPGKPLYKIADLSTIILRAYVSGNQLSQVKLDQKVKVLTDDGQGGSKETTGTITWINEKAEFTPKTIQTKDERANLVYAIKVNVVNDGSYKIGMYGEINFSSK